MFNLFVFGWESDYLTITKNDYIYEVEIKISRADFLNDFKNKGQKHLILEGKNNMALSPNYFYYAVTEGLITAEEVPEYAGLIYINYRQQCNIIKKAPKLIETPIDIDNLNLIDKFYYGYINWRNKYLQTNNNELKTSVKRLEKELFEMDNLLSEANCEIERLKHEIRERNN